MSDDDNTERGPVSPEKAMQQAAEFLSVFAGYEFDLGDGHTINRYELPGGSGWPVGVSVGQDGRLVTATSDGRVFGFAPA